MAVKPKMRYSSVVGGWVLIGFSGVGTVPKFDERRLESLWTAIVIFLGFFAMVASYELTVILYGNYAKVKMLDLLAYVFPSIAAFFAGMGIYYDKKAASLFVTSGVVLLIGFVCYAWSNIDDLHRPLSTSDGVTSVGWISASFLVLISGVTLIAMDLARKRAGVKRKVVYTRLRWVLLIVALITSPLYIYVANLSNCLGDQCSVSGLLNRIGEVPSILSKEERQQSANSNSRGTVFCSCNSCAYGYLCEVNSYCSSISICQHDAFAMKDNRRWSCEN